MECQRGRSGGSWTSWTSTFRWLLTDDGQRVLAAAGALDEPDPLRARTALDEPARTPSALLAVALTQAELRTRAREVRRPGRVDVLHARRARAGDPALRGHPPGGPAQGVRRRDGDRPRLRDRRRPGRLRPGRASPRRRRPRPGAGRGRLREPRGARPRRRGAGRRRDRGRHPPRSTWPSPTRRAGPAAGRTFDVDDWTPPLVLRGVAAGPRRLRQGRPGHPARADPRRRRGRVGQRPRRGQGGRAVGRPARHDRAPGHRHRRGRPGHADRRGRPGRRTSSRSGGSSTSRTARSSGPAWSPRSPPASAAGWSTSTSPT